MSLSRKMTRGMTRSLTRSLIQGGGVVPPPEPTDTASITSSHPDYRNYPVTDASALLAAGGPGAYSSVPVSGVYVGTPSVIQVRSIDFDTGVEVTPWATVATSPTGGVWSGVLQMKQHKGDHRLQSRAALNGSATFTTDTRIRGGVLVGAEGQSQSRYLAVNVDGTTGGPSNVPHDLISVYAMDGTLAATAGVNYTDYPTRGWHRARDTFVSGALTCLAGGGAGIAAAGALMIEALGVPVAFIVGAVGGRTISELNGSPDRPNAQTNYENVGRPHYIVWLAQGGNDLSGVTESAYAANLETWRNWHLANVAYTPRNKFLIAPLARRTSSGSAAECLAIRKAQMDHIAAHASDTLFAGWGYDITLADGIHQDLAGNVLHGSRLAGAILDDLVPTYESSDGPYITGGTRVGAVLTLNVAFDRGTALESNLTEASGSLSAAGFEVIRVSDSAALTVSSISLGTNTITLSLSADPGSAVAIRYGGPRSPGNRCITDNSRDNGLSRGAPLRPQLSNMALTEGGAAARVAKVNIGSNTVSSGEWSYNNFNAAALNATKALADTTGAALGWTLTTTAAFSSSSASGGFSSGNNSGVVPDNVLISYVTKTTAGASVIRASGLNDAKTYKITLVASRDATATRPTDFSVNGGAIQTVDAFDNYLNAAVFNAVAPVGGNIDISTALGSGNTTGAYLNAIIIEESV